MIPVTVGNTANSSAAIKPRVFEIIRSDRVSRFSNGRLRRPCSLVLLFALFALAFYATSSASSLRGSFPGSRPGAASATNAGATTSPIGSPGVLAVQPPPATESVATFAAGCVNANASFFLGDTVCAQVTGAPAGRRRLAWVNSFGLIVRTVDITSDPQTDEFTLPSNATDTIGDVTGDNRGNWSVIVIDAFEPVIETSARFVVHDPAQTVADLVVYKSVSTADSTLEVGGTMSTTLYVVNRGPDTAASVQATEVVPTGATFFSLTQISGPTFACTTPAVGDTGTITCTIASLPPGTPGIFTLVYKLTAITQNTVVEAGATSTTTDRDPTDNSSTPIAPTGGGSVGGGCTADITCPANITKAADDVQQGVSGAVATYTTPPASTCGTVACDPPSGSFFPIGANQVTCTDTAGNFCVFTVTVNAPGDITITLNGANPMTVECHANTTFTDPGATAVNGAGTSITVTTQVTCCDEASPPNCSPCAVNPGVPGAYAITYTATDGTTTATATRTVNVVDTTPPTIALTDANPMTVECHTSFTDPGATANDTCAGSFAATPSGSVNADTPGAYTITYSASDSSGNDATPVTRTVNVVDTTPPTITLNGANPITVECHTSFTDPGATAADTCAGSVAVNASGSVNVDAPGSYTITYTASDGTNTGTAARTVNVVDTTPPSITCPAGTTVTANNCQAAVPNVLGGVTALDNCTPAGSLIITQSPAAGTIVSIGTTTITVTARDAANNSSTCATTFTVSAPQLTAADPATVWVGLKNSDDVGTKFDLLAEVLKNGAVVGSAQTNDLAGGSSGFNNAISDTINVALSGPTGLCSGETLSIRLSVRVAATGHRSGTARLWFNDAAANSRFGATIEGVTSSYFLLNGFALGTAAGPGPKSTIDVFVDRAVGGNPFKPFGTWSKTF